MYYTLLNAVSPRLPTSQKRRSKRTVFFLCAGWVFALGAQAQTTNYVTEVVTTYKGLWRSGSAAKSTTLPDSSHALLAFTANNVRYSTGVSDARLTKAGLAFTAGRYQALPITAIPAPTADTKVALAQLYDRVDNGPSKPAPARDLAPYLTDGPNGLDLGTGIANIMAGTLSFTISNVQAAAINDGVPDIVITQVADPTGSTDVYSFLDANGAVVGTALTVSYNNKFPVVGQWLADFYEASTNPMTLGAGFTKTSRDLRLWSADFKDFGLVASDYSRIAKFQIKLSGSSDVAFVAYNTQAIQVASPTTPTTLANPTPLPVGLTAFAGQVQDRGDVLLTWQTASEQNTAAFEVETSLDGRTFERVGQVLAHNKLSPSAYMYSYRPIQEGITYYRLYQVDNDGSGTYSPIVTVALIQRLLGTGSVLVAPMPCSQTLHLYLPTGVQAGEAQLFALDGRQVYHHLFGQQELARATSVCADLPALGRGLYVLQVVLDGQVTRQKVVLE